jgi:hypothetical protein
MVTEKQQARHDIDVLKCKASLRAVIKQVSSIKGAYQHPMDQSFRTIKRCFKTVN